MTEQTVYILDGVPLLAHLSRAERDQTAKQCRWKRYGIGEQIIDNQSDTRDVFFVISGLARVVNYSLSGREVTLDDVGPGGYFGELAALDGAPRSANVMARQDTLAAAMPPDTFIRLVTGNAKMALAVMQGLARVVRQSTDRIMDLSTLGSNNRVHAELLRLARTACPDGRTATISPIPNHSDIASRVSTTRETVARVLSELTRSGILRRDKDALQVLDTDRLEELVETVRG